jgi:uncharacterized membrane protein
MSDARTLTIQEIRKMQNKHIFLARTLFQNLVPLVVGGTITALGVCVMHYMGMQAMVFDGRIEWNAGVVAVSVIIAVVAYDRTAGCPATSVTQ